MKKFLVLLDAGHGGWVVDSKHPNGYYPTPGKRSYKRPDGTVLFEGVNNRRIVAELKKAFDAAGIEYYDVVNSEHDISLVERVKRANNKAKQYDGETFYLSIHSNAAGRGDWSPAIGFGTYIYETAGIGTQLKAKIMHKHLAEHLTPFTKDRGIRKRRFYINRATSMSSILLELGFHTNIEETYLIQSKEWSDAVCNGIVKAINEMKE